VVSPWACFTVTGYVTASALDPAEAPPVPDELDDFEPQADRASRPAVATVVESS
jgi:hypothetical protein